MKRVILMRHAKSDWSSGGADHDRPLNARGRDGACALGEWLRDTDILPDEVLCSSAERAGETMLRLRLPEGIPTTFTKDLYLATHHQILNVLHRAKGDTILMVGHNPGMSIIASEIVKARPDHPKFDAFPTGATLVAEFDITDWADAGWGKANARHFTVPRDL